MKASKELLCDPNNAMSLVDFHKSRCQIIHHFSTDRLGKTEQNVVVEVGATVINYLVAILFGWLDKIHSGERGYSFAFLGQSLVEKNVAFAQVVHLHDRTDYFLTVRVH